MPPALAQTSLIEQSKAAAALEWVNSQFEHVGLRHLELPLTSLFERQPNHETISPRAITDSQVDHPPPPYTPTIPLHASITSAQPTSTAAPTGAVMDNAASKSHVNPGMIVGVVIGGTVLGAMAVGMVHILLKRKNIRFHFRIPSMFKFNSRQRPPPDDCLTNFTNVELDNRYLQQYIQPMPPAVVKTSSIIEYFHHKEAELENPPDLPYFPDPDPPLRRFSSPVLDAAYAGSVTADLHRGRPLSLPPPNRELSMYIEQQRSAELAQTMRMHAIQEESSFSVSTTSLPYLAKLPKLESPLCGLGLPKATHDKSKVGDAEDKATEPTEKFKYPTIPSKSSSLARARDSLKNFPKVASRRNMQEIQLPMPSSKDSKDILEDEDSLEQDVAEVVVRMAQTRSMEIKRGVLVALGGSTVDVPHLFFSSPSIASHNNLASLSSSSTSLNSDSNHLRPESAYMINMDLGDETNTFPSPPPMLSPILPTSFELSDEIEKSLGLFSERQEQTCIT